MNERIQKLAVQAHVYADGHSLLCHEGDIKKFAELIVRQCAYHADVFSALGCPVDMDPTETKPSDYIKRQMGIIE